MGEDSIYAAYEELGKDYTYSTSFGVERVLSDPPRTYLEYSLDRALQEGPDLTDPSTVFILQIQLRNPA